MALTFEDHNILRASSLKNILHNGAKIFQDSKGTAETYLQSSITQKIDAFVSHNWAVPRRAKFWALALHFNLLYAAAASYIGVALGCVLNTLEIPPTLRQEDLVMRPYCLILGSCTFFLALLMGHDVPLVGKLFCQRRLFLDKVCIHQTDPALKAAGIRNLGAFLHHSDRMLVLFHSLYVRKLWTVYELACFMYLHSMKKLDLLPLGIARVALQSTGIGVLLMGCLVVGFHLGSVLGAGSSARLMIAAPLIAFCVVPLTFIIRAWTLQRSTLFESLCSFQLSKAHCAAESDRPVVSANICSFVRSMGLVEDGASDADALLCFDMLVQEQMPGLLRNAVGRTGVPYKYALLSGTAIGFYVFDMISSNQDQPASFALAWLMYGFNVQTGVVPMAYLISAGVCNRFPPLGKWSEVALKVGTALLAMIGMMTIYLLSSFFRSKALVDMWWLLPGMAVSVVEMLAIIKLF